MLQQIALLQVHKTHVRLYILVANSSCCGNNLLSIIDTHLLLLVIDYLIDVCLFIYVEIILEHDTSFVTVSNIGRFAQFVYCI